MKTYDTFDETYAPGRPFRMFLDASVEDIVEKLFRFQPLPFADLKKQPRGRFTGPGVYAISFIGRVGLYEALPTSKILLYAGMSDGRTRKAAKSSATVRTRLNHHAASIHKTGLGLDNFAFRIVMVEKGDYAAVLPATIESRLISTYTPIWNVAIDGFGNNGVGGKRTTGCKSMWDTLHPGRSGASKRECFTREKLISDLMRKYSTLPLVNTGRDHSAKRMVVAGVRAKRLERQGAK
jgi:hypothetical protein